MTVVTVDDLHLAPDPEQRLRTAAAIAGVSSGSDLNRLIVRVPDRATNGVRVFGVADVARMLQRHGRVIDLGVTEKGTIVAVADICRRRGEVAVWTGHAIGHWSPADITQRGLGGSETAAVRLSEQLARMGYLVTLYGDFAADTPDIAGDVLLRHFDHFDFTRPLDALIGFRNATLFDHRPNARFCGLWLEDLAPAEALTEQRAQNIDRVCAVSGWHKNQIREVHPWLEEGKVAACRNGIVLEWFRNED